MASDIANVKLGVCSVTFNSVDLGYTKGGVDVEVTTEQYKVTVDQFGTTAIGDHIIGRSVVITTPLAETTIDNLVAIMPGASKVIDGLDSAVIKAVVATAIGTDLLSLAQKLTLHPKAAGASVAEDFVVPKASTAGAMNFAYRTDEERVFNCVWNAYPDTANADTLFIYGDESASA